MSSKEKHFKYLVEKGNPVGEVIAVNKYLVKVRGLHPVQPNALVMFEDGSKGFVREIQPEAVSILHLGSNLLRVGMASVVQHNELVTKVGEGFIGRVVSVTGEPLDGLGSVSADVAWPVFNRAPALIGRQELDTQLETGVTLIDAMFPVLLGQRLAILGDAKSGKSTIASQIVLAQKGSERIVVYVMIAKRRTDVNDLLTKLQEQDAMKNAIVIVSTTFDSLVMSYIAPYVAASMAEYLWQKKDRDVIIIYDDLTNHAHIYREMSLLAEVSPGRDSFPGDMFYAHSSLLERAGRIASNGKTLTCFPMVHVPGGDVTTYLPTNIMSITDGQLILDMQMFRDGLRPAISSGLSVSRVGGHGHNKRQKDLGSLTLKMLAQYTQAAEFAHFGSELALEARGELEMGERIRDLFTQAPGEYFSLMAQQLLMEIVTSAKPGAVLDIKGMKDKASEIAETVTDEASFQVAKEKLLSLGVIELKGGSSIKEQDQAEHEKAENEAEVPAAETADSDAPEASKAEEPVPAEPPKAEGN